MSFLLAVGVEVREPRHASAKRPHAADSTCAYVSQRQRDGRPLGGHGFVRRSACDAPFKLTRGSEYSGFSCNCQLVVGGATVARRVRPCILVHDVHVAESGRAEFILQRLR